MRSLLTVEHLLIIDDNEQIHEDFRKILAPPRGDADLLALEAEMFGLAPREETQEFKLHFSSQGQQGFELLKSLHQSGIRIAAAFVDMRMPPGWDGLETIQHLWTIEPELPVVICTAYSDYDWNEIVGRLGSNDQLLILKKPFDQIEVRQLATSLTNKSKLRDQSREEMRRMAAHLEDQNRQIQDARHDAEMLINSLSSSLISLDSEGRVCRANPAARQLLLLNDGCVGTPFTQLPIAWSDPQRLEQFLFDNSTDPQRSLEARFVDANGDTRILELNVCRLDHCGDIGAQLIVGTEVTTQRLMQTQLEQARKLESVGQLAAGVAHEINTPMQYINDNAQFLKKTWANLSPFLEQVLPLLNGPADVDWPAEVEKLKAAHSLGKLANSIRQIPDALADSLEGIANVSRIVAAMKEFSHPGAADKSIHCLNHILQTTATVARNEWKYVADLEFDLASSGCEAEVLSSELGQAFLNIIVNAAHAIGDRIARNEMTRGRIHISSRDLGDQVEIRIADNGGGIPERIRHRVLEPFFTTKPVGKGTGQGLAIAHGVVERLHGGRLAFEVESGVGTTFVLLIPKSVGTQASLPNAGGESA